jgi:hypothetical protein
MDYYDNVPNDTFDDSSSNNKDLLNEAKKMDRGYTKLWGFIERSDGSLKRSKIDVYTSGFIGNRIRDAETGEYYKELVGSQDEEIYFKLKMATGEIVSKNGSNALFYTSPDHCMRHLHIDVPQNIIDTWEVKRNDRLRMKRSNFH